MHDYKYINEDEEKKDEQRKELKQEIEMQKLKVQSSE